ncbi:MAG: phosphate/phosphite/phosphonate ABC transporter substrate-binding protein [Thermodesulfovibrionales bacterium]
MNSKYKRQITAIILAVVMTSLLVPSIVSAEIKFAILPRLSVIEMKNMFKPLEEYLTKEVGEKVSLIFTKDFTSFKEMIKSGQADLGFANPIIYVQLKKELDIEPLALSAEFKAGTKFRGIIIARKDSGISKLQDLKGKKLIFVDKDSAAGYIFQMLLLSKAGMDIQKDFTMLPFAKKHENVTYAVSIGTADAGGIREDDFEKMKTKVDITKLAIVGYTDYFPNWPVFATPIANKDATKKIKAALLKLKPGDPLSGKIVGSAKLDGFVAVKDKDYDELRKAAKIAGAL